MQHNIGKNGRIYPRSADGTHNAGSLPANPTAAMASPITVTTPGAPTAGSDPRPMDRVCGACGQTLNLGMRGKRLPEHFTPTGERCYPGRLTAPQFQPAPESDVADAIHRHNTEKFPTGVHGDDYYTTLKELGYGTPGCPKIRILRGHPLVTTMRCLADTDDPENLEVAFFDRGGQWVTEVIPEFAAYAAGDYHGTRTYRSVPLDVMRAFDDTYRHEDVYGARVRLLEDEGIPTSDAQAIVDAEDIRGRTCDMCGQKIPSWVVQCCADLRD